MSHDIEQEIMVREACWNIMDWHAHHRDELHRANMAVYKTGCMPTKEMISEHQRHGTMAVFWAKQACIHILMIPQWSQSLDEFWDDEDDKWSVLYNRPIPYET